ncbi:MAG: tetratricopeptide repeat protein [Spirochaetota bacterium]
MFYLPSILFLFISSNFACSASNEDEKKEAPIKSASELNNDSKRFRMLLGRYYVISKQYAKAVERDIGRERNDDAYTYILRRNATDIDAALGLANAYIKWGDELKNSQEKNSKYIEARRVLTDLAKYHETNSKVLFELARVETKLDNEELFVEYFNEAKRLDKNYKKIEAYSAGEITEYLIKMGRRNTAKSLLEQMSNNKSREPKVYYELGKFYLDLDRVNDAEEQLIRARDYAQPQSLIDPDSPGQLMYASDELMSNIINKLGEIYLIRANDIEGTEEGEDVQQNNEKMRFLNLAKNHFQESIKYDNTNIKPYMNLGNIYYSDLEKPNRREKIETAINNFVRAGAKLAGLDLEGAKYNIADVVEVAERFSTGVETELFYKLGYLNYIKYMEYKENLNEEEVTKLINITKNCFHIAYSKGDQSERINPNLNFAMGNAFYECGKYINAINHYNNIIEYYNPLLREQYINIDDSDPNKKRILFELSRAYNNLGSAQFMLYIESGKESYFNNARGNFLLGQDFYYRYNRTLISPKSSNLRNLFVGKNIDLTRVQESVSGENIEYEAPIIYKDISKSLYDYITG